MGYPDVLVMPMSGWTGWSGRRRGVKVRH